MALTEADRKFNQLYDIVFEDGSKLSIDSLLDGFKVLYEEASKPQYKKDKDVNLFLERYKDTMKNVQKLRFSPDDFQSIQVVGRGEFGEVHLVKSKLTGEYYAMKLINKYEIARNLEKSFFWEERDVMAMNKNSPWITRLDFAFQDSRYLYLVMEFIPGGDLFSLMSRFEITEEWAKFYLAETIMAVQDMHNMNYCHRDIKPDNLMLDQDGHIKLADFGSTVYLPPDGQIRTDTAVGTPDYVSPEVLESQGGKTSYGKECDWWSVGVVLFEMLCGDPPFSGDSLAKTYGNIANHAKTLVFPEDVELSEECQDLIRKMLTTRDKRLGKNGAQEIFSHPWFKDFDWKDMRKREPPYKPELKSKIDTAAFDDILDKPVSKDSFPEKPGFSGNHLPFVGFTFSRFYQFSKLVAKGPSILPQSAQDTSSMPAALPPPPVVPASSSSSSEEIEKRESQLKELKSKLEDANDESKKARRELTNVTQKMEIFEAENKDLEAKYNSVNKKLERMQKQRTDTLKELEEKNIDLEKQVTTLTMDVRNAENKAKKADEKCEVYAFQIKLLEEDVQKEKTALATLQQQAKAQGDAGEARAELQKQVDEAKARLAEKEDIIKKMFSEKAELEKSRLLVEMEAKTLKEQLASVTAARDAALAKIKDTEAQLDSLRKEQEAAVARVKKEVATQQELNAKLQADLAAAKSAADKANAEKAALEKKSDTLDLELTTLQKQYTGLKAQLDSMSKEAASKVKEGAESMNHKIIELEAALANLEASKSKVDKEYSTLKRQFDEETAGKSKALSELSEAKAQLEARSKELTKLQEATAGAAGAEEVEKLRSNLRAAQDERDTLLAAKAALESSKSELERGRVVLEVDLKENVRKLEAVQAELATLQGALKEREGVWASKKEEMEQHVADAQRQAEDARQEMESLKRKFQMEATNMESEKVDELLKEIAQLQISVAETAKKAKSAEQDKETIKIEFDSVNEELDRKQTQILDLQATHRELQSKIADLAEKYAIAEKRRQEEESEKDTFQRQVFVTHKKLENLQTKLKEAVRKLDQEMRNRPDQAKPGDWHSKHNAKKLKQELQTVQVKLEEEAKINKNLQKEIGDLKDELEKAHGHNEELAKRVAEMDKIIATLRSGDKPGEEGSMARRELSSFSAGSVPAVAQEKEGVLSLPKNSKNLKKGWDKYYIVASPRTMRLQVYKGDAKAGQPFLDVSLKNVYATEATKNNVPQAKSDQLAKMFMLLCTSTSSKDDALTPTNQGTNLVHTFKETTYHYPVWCVGCNERMWGKGMKCCNTSQSGDCEIVCHSKCSGKVPPCFVHMDAQQLIFLCDTEPMKREWLQNLRAIGGIKPEALGVSPSMSRIRITGSKEMVEDKEPVEEKAEEVPAPAPEGDKTETAATEQKEA
eukprot:comp20621_c0_seq1/m.26648 comp20621_c0_seq1/g.26648  ORF comp20621_c0_seq1/g.26648 comp20621_c0_seq1/m.26648 type:complete len:1401 (-) comp20621_c0_seq1:948-5150(-)